MTLQSYVAKAYMLSYIQQKSVEFYYVLQVELVALVLVLVLVAVYRYRIWSLMKRLRLRVFDQYEYRRYGKNR